jgi:hypothetical protein
MKVYREQAKQVHPVPKRVHSPRGPFPYELFSESAIVTDYVSAMAEDGSELPEGGTAQNNFKRLEWLYCGLCYEKVRADRTATHVCPTPDEDDEVYEDDEYYPEDDE